MDQLRQHSPSMLISHPTNQASLSFYEKNLTAAPLPPFKEGQGGGQRGPKCPFHRSVHDISLLLLFKRFI